MLKASLVKRMITKEENFSEERDVVEENDNIEDEQHEDKGSEDEYDSLQDEVPEDHTGDEEWQQWAVKEFYKGRPKGFGDPLRKYFLRTFARSQWRSKQRMAGWHSRTKCSKAFGSP